MEVVGMPRASLFDRKAELDFLGGLIARVAEGGGAVVLRGEAGIGKSSLLAEATGKAKARGMLVLTATGVQSETRLPFAGLHQLLRPVLAGRHDLPAPQRVALETAFGLTDATAPELFLIALGGSNCSVMLRPETLSCSSARTRSGWIVRRAMSWLLSRVGSNQSRSC